MSTKSTVRAGKNWHLYTEVFEEGEGPHAYLEVERATRGEFSVDERGRVRLTMRLERELLTLLDPEIRTELASRATKRDGSRGEGGG